MMPVYRQRFAAVGEHQRSPGLAVEPFREEGLMAGRSGGRETPSRRLPSRLKYPPGSSLPRRSFPDSPWSEEEVEADFASCRPPPWKHNAVAVSHYHRTVRLPAHCPVSMTSGLPLFKFDFRHREPCQSPYCTFAGFELCLDATSDPRRSITLS